MLFTLRYWCIGAALLAASTATRPVHAALGAGVDSISQDRVKVKATARIRSGASFTVHELTTPSGTVVHEYLNAAGKVFGVSWSGPAMPDLRQLLGTHFDIYADRTQSDRRGHAHRSVTHGDLVVQSAGRLRAFSGRAYLQSMIPNGVAIDDIR